MLDVSHLTGFRTARYSAQHFCIVLRKKKLLTQGTYYLRFIVHTHTNTRTHSFCIVPNIKLSPPLPLIVQSQKASYFHIMQCVHDVHSCNGSRVSTTLSPQPLNVSNTYTSHTNTLLCHNTSEIRFKCITPFFNAQQYYKNLRSIHKKIVNHQSNHQMTLTDNINMTS